MPEVPEKKYAMAFVDGQNLFQHAKAAFGHYHPNYDLIKLHGKICEDQGWQPSLIRFYTGVPSAQHSPMWAGYWSSRLLSMKRSGINVTTRPIRYRTKEVEIDGELKEVEIPQEKGIDLRLALDAIRCFRENQFNVAVIYSQDQDLNELAEELRTMAQEEDRWLHIACAFPDSPSASYRRGINNTNWIKIDQATYDSCIDPRDYRPSEHRT